MPNQPNEITDPLEAERVGFRKGTPNDHVVAFKGQSQTIFGREIHVPHPKPPCQIVFGKVLHLRRCVTSSAQRGRSGHESQIRLAQFVQ